MSIPKYLKTIEWTHEFTNGCKLDKVALFNETIVSEIEVRSWIEQGILDLESKSRVVTMTKEQYDNLFDCAYETDNNSDMFYEDLLMEQKEQM